MALNPRRVNTNTTVTWDGVTFQVVRGTIIDCAPGSALETAYGGAGNLTTLGTQDAVNVSDGDQAVGAGGSG
jgi:hypothetical protein